MCGFQINESIQDLGERNQKKKEKKKLFGLLSFETKYEKSYTFLFLSWREEEWFLELSEIKK